MKLGVFAPAFENMAFEDMLDYVVSVGVQMVEIPVGGYVGDAHCKPKELLGDQAAIAKFAAAINSRGLSISALSAHTNPLHPDPAIGEPNKEAIRNGILMAEQLGVDTFIMFSGCPGGGPNGKTPNWVTCSWPTEVNNTVLYCKVAVGSGHDPILGRDQQVCRRSWGQTGNRNAPRILCFCRRTPTCTAGRSWQEEHRREF